MILKLTLSLAATVVFGLICAPSYAQPAGPSAGNVNDCTLIPDPTELRNCILRFEGQRTPLPTTLESGTEAGGRPVEAGDGSASTTTDATPLPTKSELTGERFGSSKLRFQEIVEYDPIFVEESRR